MSLINSIFGSSGQSSNNIAANNVPVTAGVIGPGVLTANQSQAQWNAAHGVLPSTYPYTSPGHRALHLVVKQVENGYTIEIGGSIHIASDLKDITDVLTNRIASTLLDWNK